MLYARNMDVDRLNSQELAKLRGEEVVYEASAWGKEPFLKALQRGCTGAQGDAWPRCLLWRCLLTTFCVVRAAPKKLRLKVGAQVPFWRACLCQV